MKNPLKCDFWDSNFQMSLDALATLHVATILVAMAPTI